MLYPKRFLTSVLFTIFVVTSSSRIAAADSAEGIDLSLNDQLVISTENNPKTTIILNGKRNSYYVVAISQLPVVLVEKENSVALAPSAVVIASGRFSKDGDSSFQVTLPKADSGRLYMQAYSSRNSQFQRVELSPVRRLTILKDFLNAANFKGEKGDKGDTGPAGAQGPMGEQGPMGPQGLQGLKGDTGAQGIQGLTGAEGAQGPMGPAGIQGAQGEKGDTGAVGPQGLKGDTGAVGAQGETGAAGPMGPQGMKGDKGDTGATGAQGETGAVGPQGAKGDKGDTGVAGPQGLKGDTGATGAQGAVGPMGAKGDTGAAGPQGLKGDKGDVGPAGPAGPAGPQGIAGVTPQMQCPANWKDLGPTCMQPTFSSAGTIEQAINDCYSKGARVCEHQDLAFACSNRDNLNIPFPDDVWLFTGSVILRTLGSTSSFVAYTVYRRAGNRCFGPATVNPTDGVVSYELSNTVRSYTCCADRTF